MSIWMNRDAGSNPGLRRRALTVMLMVVLAVVSVSLGGVLFSSGKPTAVAESPPRTPEPGLLHPVTIHRPDGPPRIDAVLPGGDGKIVGVACATCHDAREPDRSNTTASRLDDFHVDLPFAHGDLTCFECHAPPSYAKLRLADDQTIDYPDVMTLCGQCHGGILASYEHGAHGGMNGYWDLTRGPRTRNNCIDCHDPHVPAYPKMKPTFKPRDRRPVSAHGEKGAGHE